MLKNIILIFVVLFSCKLIFSIIDFLNILRYKNLYYAYIGKKNNKIFQYKTACINLFKKINISDAKIPISQKTGYGQIANFTTSLFANFPDNTNLFATETFRIFEDAIGIYRHRIIECFSPRYWINIIIFLPKNILTYLNVSADSIFIRICQIIYWIIGTLITLFSNDIANFIKSFFAG